MTEHVLQYDRVIAPQERPWDCGPASTQIVLNGRGIIESEDNLIRDIGTTVNGTDDVSWVERSFDRRLPQANYTSVHLTNWPPTNEERETLWRNVVTSINVGYGVVVNIDVTPANYPRGIKGSQSPAYNGHGEVFHYVAAMGYDDDPSLRAVWIADPGFRPFGYWVSLDQLVTMIVPKGYAYANVQVQHNDSIEEMLSMATNQEKLDFIYDKLNAYGGEWLGRGMFGPANEPAGGVDDTVGMLLNGDGNAWNVVMIIGALLGVERDVQAIKDNAAGKFPAGSYVGDNAWLRKRAQEFAKKLEPLCGTLGPALTK